MKVSALSIVVWSLGMMGCGALIYHFSSDASELDKSLLEKGTAGSSRAPGNQDTPQIESGVFDVTRSSDNGKSEIVKTPAVRELSEIEKSQVIREFLLGTSGPESIRSSSGRHLRLIGMEVFDTNGNVTETFAQVYGLSEDELHDLSRRSDGIREDYYALASEHSTLSEYEHGSVRVEIEPFEGGEDLYSRLLDSFEQVLGPTRFSDFMKMSEQRISDNFYQFGGERLDVLVTPFMEERQDPEGNPVDMLAYKVSIKKEGFNRNGSSTYNGLSEEDFSEKFGIVKRLIDDAKTKP